MADKKGGKKSAGPDDIMSPADMKPILAQAKRGNPASCAIGLTKDKEGVVLLDKRKKPKKLMAELKKQAAGAGLELDMASLRFGHALVDAEEGTNLLKFSVNKEAPGAMRPKLLEHVKKAGFGKIEIVVDAGLEAEPEEEEAADASGAASSAPPQAPVSMPPQPPAPPPPQASASASTQAPAAAAPPTPAAPAAPGGQPATADTAGLSRTLTDLVKRMLPVIAADPSRQEALKSLAVAAQTALKAGDTGTASGHIDALGKQLDRPAPPQPGGAPQPANGPGAPAFAKARLAWTSARKKVESEVGKLHAEMTSVYKNHGFAADLDKYFRAKVDPVLESLDETLAEKLDEVSKNADPQQHAKLVGEAKQIIQRYESYLASEPLIAKLDANPFVPLAIEKTLTATLSALDRVVS